MKNVFLSALFLLAATPAMADGTSRPYAMGGRFERFDPVVAQYNASGERFRIEGHCQSACTLFLSIRNVCVEPGARLLFHAGNNRQRQISITSTNHMLNAYNAKLREFVVANRYMETLEFHTISGRDIIQKFGYPACPRK